MKKLTVLIFLLFFGTLFSVGQNMEPAPADKAVVYFVRTSALGFAINFMYFDSTKLIGRFNGPKYIRYECEPGYHLFWARSENRDFVDAELDSGKIYFIEALVKMGALKAEVELLPVDTKDLKRMMKIFNLMGKKPSESFTASELAIETSASQDIIERGLEKYKVDKSKGKEHARLEKSMFYVKPVD